MTTKLKTTWLAVGDGSGAQFYSIHAIPLRLSPVPAGALKATRKLTEGPEHQPESLHATHISPGHGDHQRHENVFIERIAETLEAAAQDGEYDDIIVVFPPKALAHFRKIAGPDLKKRIKQEICGEWSQLAVPDLEHHLAAELP
ncbi:MAG: host attachment protein [Rhodospirillaceae bacterium]